MLRIWLAVIALVASLVETATAQDSGTGDPVFERYGTARSLRCDFQTGTVASWDSGSAPPAYYFLHSTSTVYLRAWAATSLAESFGSADAVS